jgi:hypothetical protein
MKGSWRTSILGWIALLAAVTAAAKAVFDNDPYTHIDVDALAAAAAGVGLLFARDNKVTSEQAGAKK